MGSYQLNIHAGVTGAEQVDRLATGNEKLADRTRRVDEAVKSYAANNDKLQAKLLEVERAELTLEKTRESHRMQTERLAAAQDKLAAGDAAVSAGMVQTTSSTMAATTALREFEGGLPIRAAGRFLSQIQGIGPLLQMAFPIMGAVALFGVVEKIGEKLGVHLDFWNEITRVQKASTDQLRQAQREYDGLIDKLKTLQKEERRRALIAHDPKNGKMAADIADATDGQDLATASARVSALKDQLRVLDRLASLPGIRQEDTFRRAALEHPGLVSDSELFQADTLGVESQEEAKARRPGVRGELRAAEQALFNARKEQQAEMGKVDDDVAKKAEEAKRNVEALQNRLRAFEEQMYDRGNPISRIFDQRDDLIKAGMKVGVNPDRATDAALSGAVRELAKEQGAVDKRTIEVFGRGQKALDKVYDDWAKSQMPGLDRADRSALQTLDEARKTRLKLAEGDLRDVRDTERRSMSLLRVSGQLAGQSDRDQVDSQYGARLRFAEQEYQAELKIADQKKTDDEKEGARTQALDDKRQKIFDAQMEREHAILEIALRQKQEFEQLAVGLFRAARGGHVGGFLLQQVEGIADKVVSNLAGMAWKDIAKHIPHASGSLGRVLQGTIFGPDPARAATDLLRDATTINSSATTDNTQAIRDLTADIRAQRLSGSDGAGPFSSAASTLGRMAGLSSRGGAYEDIGAGSIGTAGMARNESGMIIRGPAYDTPGSGETATEGSALPTEGRPGDAAGETRGSSNLAGAIGKGVGYAAAGYGAYQGISTISKGGARSVTGGLGELAGAASAIMMLAGVTGPAAPIVAAAGIALGMISSLFGDPRQNRANAISNTLAFHRYIDPVSINASMGTNGGYADFDRFGGIRGSGFSPFPTIQPGYFDPQHNVVPGRTLGQFGNGPAVHFTYSPQIHSVDGTDLRRVLDRHSDVVGDSVLLALDRGHAGLQESLRRM